MDTFSEPLIVNTLESNSSWCFCNETYCIPLELGRKMVYNFITTHREKELP